MAASLVVAYVIQNLPDLHKRFVRFSQPKSFNSFTILDEYERLHAFVSQAIYNIRARVESDIQSLILYIYTYIHTYIYILYSFSGGLYKIRAPFLLN